ncbi:cytochrome P450 [Aaosphaeria arxii CBS 175.79]|uniref:Cytochrome P450 n=1 Tax=Aaosphaeria arxii CBS 175.79 TaxID=1450172 RepID=A0A6A5X722_9PLEO|nr:cytochrome P450 [Aaosphaeria arxii CBS 175.79]KAF2008702.1 cytochrome P450 [Aaosphaeria arxii CBS 175.79]
MVLSKLFVTVSTSIATVLIYVLIAGYRQRSRIYRLQQQGVAIADGWSWWFGHLLVLNKKLRTLPHDANIFMVMDDVINKHEDTGYFVMDYWPMFQPVLLTFSPEIATQVSSRRDFPKPADQENSFRPIIGGPSLITMHETQWKFWRSLFNNGFSASHMLSLVPSLVDTVDIFCEQLFANVDGDIFFLDDMAMQLTMDIIIKTTLDIDLDNQRAEHQLSHALNTILDWHSFWDPRILLNPLRLPVQWYYGRCMDGFIKAQLQRRFEEMKSERSASTSSQIKKAKSVIALALEEHMSLKYKEGKQASDDLKLDPQFANIAANQIRMFLFAGNDSTATTLVYTYHLLSQNPVALAKLREEHALVFHSSEAGDQLREDPSLINQCPYTLAVIKEALRLFPASSAIRDGIVEFVPERWLVGPGHPLYPKSPLTSYRPFEHGTRNCIAQTLVYNELRVALIMTARKFDIKPAYEEWDCREKSRQGIFVTMMETLGLKGEQYKTVLGERAYQTSRSGAHPADRYPCRVSLAQG